MQAVYQWTALLLLPLLLTGCGGDDSDSSDSDSTSKATNPGEAGGNSASDASVAGKIDPPRPEINEAGELDGTDEAIDIKTPKTGTPRWFIYEIARLRVEPLPTTEDATELRAARHKRNREIGKLAEDAIALTIKDPNEQQVYTTAVHHLLDSTYERAIDGDAEAADDLYGIAEQLFVKRPDSKAAAEAGWYVARYTNENAKRHAAKDTRWLTAFAREARSFAIRFPNETQKAVKLLDDAAFSCDSWGLTQEAIQCYSALQMSFPEHRLARQAAGPLRRLNLVGKVLDLGGPTLDGGFLSANQFKGRPLLIVFWSSQARPFVEKASTIIQTVGTHEDNGLEVIGVNLDTEEPQLDAFLEKTGLGWRTIFHTDKAKRGWNHPVVSYYGVRTIPQIWLVDAEGKVVSTTINANQISQELNQLLTPRTAKKAAGP